MPITMKQTGYTNKHYKLNLLRNKGSYPYEYITSPDVLNETQLPPIEEFKTKLKPDGITQEEYDEAQIVWKEFNCKTLKEYHNIYLIKDVLLLADCFETFRKVFLTNHNIDPYYYYSTPGLTWDCGLKYTGVVLDTIENYDMYLMIEKGIRGGYSGVLGTRYVKANNYKVKDYDSNKPSNWLAYLDANNLYGGAMQKHLPTGNLQWEEDLEYYKHLPNGKDCFIECDLEYPMDVAKKTFKFPLCPEKRKVNENELGSYQHDLIKRNNEKFGNVEKLILDLHDKNKYVLKDDLLNYYIKMGIKVKTVHRIISFDQSTWLMKYIDFNTNQRTIATTDFEKDIWKNIRKY
jgi:hypothetical protein